MQGTDTQQTRASVRVEVAGGFYLSAITQSDRSALLEHLKDPEIARNLLAVPFPYTESNADWWLDFCDHLPGPLTIFALRKASGELIGEIGLVGKPDPQAHRAEFGYWLAGAYRGQGLMPRAIEAFVTHVFARLGVHRLEATPFCTNAASHRALEKAGFQREGILRHFHCKEGVFIDAVLYARLAGRGPASQEAAAAKQAWHAVKCLFSHPTRAVEAGGHLYEERTTLWCAASWEEAFALAELEGREYASVTRCEFIHATDAFQLFEPHIGHGSEIWSVMRDSHMDSRLYTETFCATPRDRSSTLNAEDSPEP